MAMPGLRLSYYAHSLGVPAAKVFGSRLLVVYLAALVIDTGVCLARVGDQCRLLHFADHPAHGIHP